MQRLTAAQFAEWMAFFKIEPDADARSDYLVAQQLALLSNVHYKLDEPSYPIDFLTWLKADKDALEPKAPTEQRIDSKNQIARLKALFSKKGKS